MGKGLLRVETYQHNSLVPFQDAKVTITPISSEGKPMHKIEFNTNDIGRTDQVELTTPSKDESLHPGGKMPYSTANITISASGYVPVQIMGTQILPGELSIQSADMFPADDNTRQKEMITIEILPVVLNGDYPSKIPEEPMKHLQNESGFKVLPEPVIPQYIEVQIGGPTTSGPIHKVLYQDYIKNVICSEIYATWSENAIRANALAILSFTMNRIYTEWYRSKGKPFQITNSTAYDQYFVPGRNIYENVSRIVDEMFTQYVKRPGSIQPLFTQYCDGHNVKCPKWLSQWGCKDLSDKGMAPMDILKHYYGDNLVLETAKKVLGIPESYPGSPIKKGSNNARVRTIQQQLNAVSNDYPLIKKIAVDGEFGPSMEDSVKTFQKIFGLTQDGIIGPSTWYKISTIYTAVTKIAELRNESSNHDVFKEKKFIPPSIPVFRNQVPTANYYDED